jgi:hypothetical protein
MPFNGSLLNAQADAYPLRSNLVTELLIGTKQAGAVVGGLLQPGSPIPSACYLNLPKHSAVCCGSLQIKRIYA